MNTTHLPSICFRLLRTQHHQRLHKLHKLFSSRHLTTTSSSTRQTLFHGLETVHEDPLHGGNKYTKVPRRGLVEIEGSEAAKFLQGMCTNHIPAIQNGGDGFFAAILSPQGRVLYDVFIYPRNIGNEFPHPRFLIECDSLTTDSLVSHLKKYLLRTRAVVRDVSEEYNIWSVWGPATGRLWSDGNSVEKVRRGILSASELILKERRWSEIGCRDGRGPGMGLRLVVLCEESLNTAPDFTELADDEYTLRRILKGVPEGSDDIVPGQSLPLESNFDYMGGIDFRKGCYIGQELTIRTYHTGVTRKRIMPVQILYEGTPIPSTLTADRSSPHPILAPGADLVKNNTQTTSETDTPLITSKRSERPIGRLGSNVSGVGLALLRLEAVMHSREELLIARKGAEAAVEGEVDVRVKPMVPTWWPSE